jgi:hypothetical protein
MQKRTQRRIASAAIAALLEAIILSQPLRAEDKIEKAGATLALTAGNLLFVPMKAVSVSVGAIAGALSFVLTGGNADLTRQIWRDTSEGPYVITPALAKKAIGERPELDLE